MNEEKKYNQQKAMVVFFQPSRNYHDITIILPFLYYKQIRKIYSTVCSSESQRAKEREREQHKIKSKYDYIIECTDA